MLIEDDFTALDDKDEAKRPKRQITRKALVSCEVCGVCIRSDTLKRHMRRHDEVKEFVCEVCSRDFKRKDHLQVHMRLHTGERPYECTECGERFAHKTTLDLHCDKHTGNKRYYCDVCGVKFTQMGSMKTHKTRFHKGASPGEGIVPVIEMEESPVILEVVMQDELFPV